MRKITVEDIMEGEEEKYRKDLYTGKYIQCITEAAEKYGCVDDTYFLHETFVSEDERYAIDHLQEFIIEVNKCRVLNNKNVNNLLRYYFSYNNKYYEIGYNGESYYFRKTDSKIADIDYSDIEKMYEKNMKCNFELLWDRVIDSLSHTDLEQIRHILSNINDSTIITGVGGSSVVSKFASKVLNQKNKIIATNSEPRDMIYRSNAYKNVIACTYSGNKFVTDLSFREGLKKYLLSTNSINNDNITNLTYREILPREKSFISLATTLIPVSILLDYYTDGNSKEFIDLIKEKKEDEEFEDVFEIFSGYDTSTASKYLESTITEAGIGIPIVHDKYSYCHGRSTLGYHADTTAIYFNRNTEFDKIMLEELRRYHKNIIVIDSMFDDQVLDDYQMLIKSMYLTKQIAESKGKDLSKVEYSPIVKKLYKYNGEI